MAFVMTPIMCLSRRGRGTRQNRYQGRAGVNTLIYSAHEMLALYVHVISCRRMRTRLASPAPISFRVTRLGPFVWLMRLHDPDSAPQTIGPAMEMYRDSPEVQNAVRVGGEEQREM